MRTLCRVVVFGTFSLASAWSAWAQAAPDVPTVRRAVEVGASVDGFGAVTSFGGGGLAFANVRAGVPLARRFSLEAFVAVPRKDSGSFIGVYGIQVKQRLVRASSATREVFATYGGIGLYEHTPAQEGRYTTSAGRTMAYRTEASTFVSPPLLPMIGAGLQQRLSNRVGVRVEAQGFPWPYPVAVVVRVSAGVSIALGRAAAP